MDKRLLKSLIKLIFGIIAVSGIWWAVKCHCFNLKALTPPSIRDYIQGFGPLAAIIYILAYALNTVSVFPPIGAISLSAGLAFGFLWGSVYLVIGAMLGVSCTFFISRFFGRGLAEKLLRGRFRHLDDLLEKRGFLTILFFRIIPVIPYEILNYTSGLSKIRFKDYFFASFLGFIPGVVIAAFFGSSIGEIRSLKDIFSLRFSLALLAFAVVIAVPLVCQGIKKRKPAFVQILPLFLSPEKNIFRTGKRVNKG